MPMEIAKVREALAPVVMDHSKDRADPAIRALALAMLHIAEGIEDLHRRLPLRSEYF